MNFPTKASVLAQRQREEADRLKGEYTRVSSFINKTLREKASATITIRYNDWNTKVFKAMEKELNEQGWSTSYSNNTERFYIS